MDKKRMALAGSEIAFIDEGEGPAVLMLHGFPTSSHLWRDLVPLLATGFRVIAPDLLGYGDSEKPNDPEALTIRAQASAMRELVTKLGVEELAVVGHDIGGGVAQLVALEGQVRAMVLIDSICFDSWPIEGVKMLQQARDDQVDEEFIRGLVSVSLEMGMSEPERLLAEDRDEFVRPWLAEPLALLRAARAIDGVGLVGTEGRLAELESRALVLWGEDDPFQPAELAERLGEAIPGATVALVPGASHFVTEDAPDTVLPLISEYLRVHHLRQGHAHHEGPTPVELGISFQRPDEPPPEGFEDLG